MCDGGFSLAALDTSRISDRPMIALKRHGCTTDLARLLDHTLSHVWRALPAYLGTRNAVLRDAWKP